MILIVWVLYCGLLVSGKSLDIQPDERNVHNPHAIATKVQQWTDILDNGSCGFPMFTCHTTGVCIYFLSAVCDGVFDCYNGEDEMHCTHADKAALHHLNNLYGYTPEPTAHHSNIHTSKPHTSSGQHFNQITQQPETTSTQRITTGTSPSTVTPHWIEFTPSQGQTMPLLG
ncbi:uncharacterized protein [Argopecten irradians]|uniref:uncharacterized protein n=1 Tax=Argopecten irradians TaxID=31199 RepID=UPI00371A0464